MTWLIAIILWLGIRRSSQTSIKWIFETNAPSGWIRIQKKKPSFLAPSSQWFQDVPRFIAAFCCAMPYYLVPNLFAFDLMGTECRKLRGRRWQNHGKHMGRIVKTWGRRHHLPRFLMFWTVEPWWSPTFSKGNWMFFSWHFHFGLKVQPSLHSSSTLDADLFSSKVWKTTVFSWVFSWNDVSLIYNII